jgi:hypothetical protein
MIIPQARSFAEASPKAKLIVLGLVTPPMVFLGWLLLCRIPFTL